MKRKENYAAIVERVLSKYPKLRSRLDPASYIGGGKSSKKYIGIRVPHIQQALKEGFSFSHFEISEQAKIWNQIWSDSNCFEVMAAALYWFDHKEVSSNLPHYWNMLKNWPEKIDNWAHSDGLCSLYARILEDDPKIFSQLTKWSQSNNPWKRRISIVSLLYYSSQRKKILPFGKIIKLVDRQLIEEDYYVQKGLGWTLRELSNVYPKQTKQYIEKNLTDLSSIAFTTAIEKVNKTQKEKWKKKRKIHRKNRVMCAD